jgi:hypothetical protein
MSSITPFVSPWAIEMARLDSLDTTPGRGHQPGVPQPMHASTPAHPLNQSTSEFSPLPPSTRPPLATISDEDEDDDPTLVAADTQRTDTPPSDGHTPRTTPPPVEPPDTALDAEIARKMIEKDRKDHGLPPFPGVQKTKSG